MKVCQKCQIEKPYAEFHRYSASNDGHQRWCKVCKGQAAIERRKEKGDLLREQTRIWKQNHPERAKIYNKTYYDKPESKTKRQKYVKSYNQTPNGKYFNLQRKRKRRAIEKNAFLEDIPQSFIDLLLLKQNNECRYCEISFNKSPFPYEVEHVTPYERGGFNIRGNIQLACKPCNSGKKDKTHEEYLGERHGN